MAQRKKEEEERRVREAEEKKQREIEEKRMRLEEAEKKRQAMLQAMKDKDKKGPNFTIAKKDAGVVIIWDFINAGCWYASVFPPPPICLSLSLFLFSFSSFSFFFILYLIPNQFHFKHLICHPSCPSIIINRLNRRFLNSSIICNP